MFYRFGEFELDSDAFELRRSGHSIGLPKRAIETLIYLIGNRDRVVTRDDLMRDVWDGVAVTNASFNHAIMLIRGSLGRRGADQAFIRTVRGRGYRFVAALADAPAAGGREPAARAAVSTTFGYETEVAEAAEWLREALAGRGGTVTIRGEPGIGKSHVMRQLCEDADRQRAEVIRVRSPGESTTPYPWICDQVLRAFADVRGRQSLAHLGHGPALESLSPWLFDVGAAELVPPAGDTSASSVVAAFGAFLRAAARNAPLVVAIEGLERADDASLRCLADVDEHLRDAPVLLIGSFCQLGGGGDVLERSAFDPLGHLPRIELQGLDEGACGLLASAAADQELSPPLRSAIHRISRGNPLWVREVARRLTRGGAAQPEPLDPSIFAPPRRFSEAVRLCLRRMPPAACAAVSLASAFGTEVDLEALRVALGCSREDAITAIEPAVQLGLLASVAGRAGTFVFPRDWLRDAVYLSLPLSERSHMHDRVGMALATPTPRVSHGELARHFVLAAPICGPERAIEHSCVAGEEAAAARRYLEAAAFFQQAAEMVATEPSGARPARQVLLSLAAAKLRAGDPHGALGAAGRALTRARAAGDPTCLARAACIQAEARRQLSFGPSDDVAVLEEAAAAVELEHPGLAARLGAYAAVALHRCGEGEASQRRIAEATAMARRTRCKSTLASCLRALSRLASETGTVGAAVSVTAEMVTAADASGDREVMFDVRMERIDHLLRMGHFAGANLEHRALKALAAELGQPFPRWIVSLQQATLRFVEGAFDEAQKAAEAAFAIAENCPTVDPAAMAWLQRASIERQLGAALQDSTLPRALPVSTDVGLAYRAAAVAVAFDQGDRECAREQLPILLGERRTRPRDGATLLGDVCLAEVAARVGDRATKHFLYSELLPYRNEQAILHPGGVYWGPVAHPLGVLAATLGEPKAVVEVHGIGRINPDRRARA